MPTRSVADYQVLRDSNLVLDSSQGMLAEWSFTIAFPSDVETSGSSRQPIFAFKALPYRDSDFSLVMNGRSVLSTSLETSHTRMYWEIISWSRIAPSGTSIHDPFDCRLVLTSGRLRIADVVWWYQVRLP